MHSSATFSPDRQYRYRLKQHPDPIGPDNDAQLAVLTRDHDLTVLAWVGRLTPPCRDTGEPDGEHENHCAGTTFAGHDQAAAIPASTIAARGLLALRE